MSKAERREIVRGIGAYRKRRRYLLRWAVRWRSQAEFDAEFSAPNCYSLPMGERWSDDTFMLGTLYGGEWSKWLDLCQCMIRLGTMRARKKDGLVWYKAAPGEPRR